MALRIEIGQYYAADSPVHALDARVKLCCALVALVAVFCSANAAQLGASDMRGPIQYALSFPERWEASAEAVNWWECGPLTFDEPDEGTFGCLALAREAGRRGGTLPCAMNAANEVANAAFCQGLCGFLDIERVVSRVMDETEVERVETLEQLDEVDARARARPAAVLSEVSR